MGLSKGSLLQLAIVVLADLAIAYLTVESLEAFTGAPSLPISSLLVVSAGLSPLLAGTTLSLIVVLFAGAFVYWLWRYTPEFITRYLGSGRKAASGQMKAAAPASPDGAMRVAELQLTENAETKPFVDIIQLEGYPLNIYAAVTKEEGREGYTYSVIEPSLSEAEKARLTDLKKLLIDELDVDLRSIETTEKAERYLSAKVKELARKYGYKIPPPTMTKLLYYLTRDFIHLGKIEPLMRDKLIEDISCDGARIPIYIWYRDYESIPTNISFDTEDELDTFVSKLAYSAGKHVSLAEPIVDASLLDGSRLHLTYGKEITQRGSTFTVRKFRVDPLTIVDLIRYNTLSSDIAAYLWYLIEKKLALLIAGGTASGKTTSLNALSMFIEPGEKIVSVEDTPELNLPHENWIQSVTRGVGTAGEITMFDLLKASLRQRPDVLIVGEVRGEEAYTLLQSIASVTGDTEVLIRRDGAVKLMGIGELIDDAYKPGVERIPVAMEGVEVLTFDSDKRTVFGPVQYALRHRANEVYSIRYAGGRVRATGSHSVFVFNDAGALVTKAVSDLREHDILASFCGSHTPRDLPVVNVREILKTSDADRLVEKREKAKCPRCGSLDTIRKGRYGQDWRYLCNGCERIFNGSTYQLEYQNLLQQTDGTLLVAFSRSKSLPEEITVDEDFAEVLGIYLADGCVKTADRASRVVFSLGKGEKEMYVGVLERFFARFDARASVDDRGTYTMLEFNHTPLARLFESLCGARLQEKHVPPFIWTAPRETVASFLEGWKADARRKTKRVDVSYTSARPDLVRTLSWLARMNGYTTFISERKSKYQSVYTSKNEKAKNRSIPAQPFVRLKHLIGSTAWRFAPSDKAKTIRKSVAAKALDEILAKRKTPMTREAEDVASNIRKLLEGSLIASRVIEVRREEFEGYVYDLSVPQTEAFYGGESPVALHNTGHGGLGTIHADSVEATINRLTTEPMNIPRSLVGTTLDCIVMQLKLRVAERSVRRVVAVTEVVGHDARTGEIVLNDAFKWDPVVDRFAYTGRSKLFDKITQKFGTRPEEIRREIDGRKVFLDWLVAKNIRGHAEVSNQIREFYAGPYAVINKAKVELEGMKA